MSLGLAPERAEMDEVTAAAVETVGMVIEMMTQAADRSAARLSGAEGCLAGAELEVTWLNGTDCADSNSDGNACTGISGGWYGG